MARKARSGRSESAGGGASAGVCSSPRSPARSGLSRREHTLVMIGLGLGTVREGAQLRPAPDGPHIQLAVGRAGRTCGGCTAPGAKRLQPKRPTSLIKSYIKRPQPKRPTQLIEWYDFQLYSGLSNSISSQFFPKGNGVAQVRFVGSPSALPASDRACCGPPPARTRSVFAPFAGLVRQPSPLLPRLAVSFILGSGEWGWAAAFATCAVSAIMLPLQCPSPQLTASPALVIFPTCPRHHQPAVCPRFCDTSCWGDRFR
jgi:hypothetical protein